MKVALYGRVSTRDKGQNPEMQLEPMRNHCQAMGWNVYQEYVDKVSAADLVNRTAWTQLMKDASLHKFDCLLIWKLDRAFRSNVHAHTTLGMLRAYNIKFKSLTDPLMDTTTPQGELVFAVAAAFAQFEKDLIVQRINAGMDYAKEHGTKSGREIGRPRVDIPLQTICKAVLSAKNNYSLAARELSKDFHQKVSAGFISLRIKRAGLTKNTILQRVGSFSEDENTTFEAS